MTIKICVGSSCHLKGSSEIVRRMKEKVEEHNLAGKVTLCGAFCSGGCDAPGVVVEVDGTVHNDVTPDGFDGFFNDEILKLLKG